MTALRVALLAPDIGASYGWARYALDLARALGAAGLTVTAVIQRSGTVDDDAMVDAVRPILPGLVPRQRGVLMRGLLGLPALYRAVADCDVIHVMAEPYAPLAASVRGRRPLILTAHGTYVPQTVRRRWAGPLYRWAYAQSTLIAVSDFTATQVRAALPGSDPHVIHNGVHYAAFQVPAPAPLKLGPTILAAGGVKARKGTHLLVEALAQVREGVPNARLVVTGRQDDAAYLAQVEAQIAALGLTEAVHLPGMISEEALRGWYQHADVFVLPALNTGDRFEGFGLVFLEAGACGLPVIGTAGSGVAEAVREDETGLLVPQDDVPALADAILRVLQDDALAARLGAAGRAYAQSHTWDGIARQVIGLYHAALGR